MYHDIRATNVENFFYQYSIVTWLGTPKLTPGSPGFITEKSGNIRPGSDKHPPFFRKTLELNGKSRRCYDFDVTLKNKNRNCLKRRILMILKEIKRY